MQLVEACPLPTPADAERLLADVWQLTTGRGVGLFLFGLGERVVLGVHSAHVSVEEAAASMIADQCGAAVEPGGIVTEIVDTAVAVASVNLVPTDRRLAVESRTYGWQRTDPLRGTFLVLANPPRGVITGLALGLRALPDLGFAVSLGAFAASASAGAAAPGEVARLAASLGGVGVRVRRPLGQRRAARRMLGAMVRRPVSVRRVEAVTAFWHPPYGSDADLPLTTRLEAAPTARLAAPDDA